MSAEKILKTYFFHRGLTLDLLEILEESDLNFSPGGKVTTWGEQFLHMGRVQKDYMDALSSLSIKFRGDSLAPENLTIPDIINEYKNLDKELVKEVNTFDRNKKIDWYGNGVTIEEHICYLSEHEVFHHGQWATFLNILKRPFPKSWKAWGF